MKMDTKTAQIIFAKAGTYTGAIDGIAGRGTNAAIELGLSGFNGTLQPNASRLVAAVQGVLKVAGLRCNIDGFYGPQTERCIEDYLGVAAWRDDDKDDGESTGDFPRYGGIRDFYGNPGEGLKKIKAPYAMVLAWDTTAKVKNITVHSKCADNFEGMLNDFANDLGHDKIQELGLHLFGGSFNIRKMRGGSKYSTHSWAVAMDFDPTRNALRTKHPNARLSKDDAKPVWEIVEKHGLVGLGPKKNYDWMHIQAVEV